MQHRVQGVHNVGLMRELLYCCRPTLQGNSCHTRCSQNPVRTIITVKLQATNVCTVEQSRLLHASVKYRE